MRSMRCFVGPEFNNASKFHALQVFTCKLRASFSHTRALFKAHGEWWETVTTGSALYDS